MNFKKLLPQHYSLTKMLWNLWCCVSVIGMWPRFIEPNLLKTTKISLPILNLPPELSGLKVVQFTDLHFQPESSSFFLSKLSARIKSLSPDIVLFTGDFLCFSKMQQPERLQAFLNSINAPYGCFTILGNHDYDRFISVNQEGEYDVNRSISPTVSRGFRRLFKTIQLKNRITPAAQASIVHPELIALLKNTPFQLLHNETIQIAFKGASLNLSGLGEYTAGKCDPERTFKTYDKKLPGIVMAHHPDSIDLLRDSPGDIILSGHTHGAQINLPWFRTKFTHLKNTHLVKGLVQMHGKRIYINRGVGSVMKFRWFSPPELLLLTLESSHEHR